MQTTFAVSDLQRSVISVPPLCWDRTGQLSAAENLKVIRHIEAGGVDIMLYGGNANFYGLSLAQFEIALDQLEEAAAPDTLIIPSVGPYFGTAMDQVEILMRRNFPTAMLLPTIAVSRPEGVRQAVLRIVEKLGRPIILYVKDENYVTPAIVKSLVDDGALSWIKYAVVREDPTQDDLLEAICAEVPRDMIVTGIGEQPVIAHWTKFGIRAFTAGCVCIAPRRSQEMLLALKAGDLATADRIRQRFEKLEDLRNAHGPIPVLHEAVALAGIAQTGPHLPLMSDVGSEVAAEIEVAAKELLAWQEGE